MGTPPKEPTALEQFLDEMADYVKGMFNEDGSPKTPAAPPAPPKVDPPPSADPPADNTPAPSRSVNRRWFGENR